MNKFVTIISCALALASFSYIFNADIMFCCFIGIAVVIILVIGFNIENLLKTKGNDFINRIIYYCTPNNKTYNIISEHLTYSCLGNGTYRFEKEYELYPNCQDLDRYNDRFSWSASSAKANITPTKQSHEINRIWQQDMWTCYTIYFNERCEQHKSYKSGVVIDNLVDKDNLVLPYLSATIGRKTKYVTLVVKIPKNTNPKNAQLKIYSLKNGADENGFEDLEYDDSVGGFHKTINYPRKGWRYVISWEI